MTAGTKKKKIINTLGSATVIVAIASALLIVVMLLSVTDGDRNDANAVGEKSGFVGTTDKPIIIWYQDPWRDPNVVRQVLNHGLFSHVMLVGIHKFDNPPYHTKPFVKETIRLCKQKGVKVIWTRWLYPGYKFEKFDNKDAFDAMYYVKQIRLLRQEARQIGADLVAFDAEPNAYATMKSLKHRKLSRDEFERMQNAIKKAVEMEGPVDFILPAGKSYTRHMYNATRYLGKYVVAEFTYYDRPISPGYSKIPYDIFGAFVSIRKENKDHPHLPFFTPREILERQDLWAHKKGLFIYPGHTKNTVPVAVEFSKITSIWPMQDSNDVR